ncbi:MAG: hypothetical protein JOZ73_12030 [Solirubrobacterales bacterium]|nr:hypothetical protein [Solirubrobacterales bacterium]
MITSQEDVAKAISLMGDVVAANGAAAGGGDGDGAVEVEQTAESRPAPARRPDGKFAAKAPPSEAEPEGDDPGEGVAVESGPAKEEAAKKESSSEAFARAMARERAARERERAAAASKAEYERMAAESKKSLESKEALRARLKEDPIAAVRELGLTFEELVEVAARGSVDPNNAVARELAALKAKVEQREREEAEARDRAQKQRIEATQQQQFEAALNVFADDMLSSPKSFPYASFVYDKDQLKRAIQGTARLLISKGEDSSDESIQKAIESGAKKYYEGLTERQKAKAAAESAGVKPVSEVSRDSVSRAAKTIRNRDASVSTSESDVEMTRDERARRAAALLINR